MTAKKKPLTARDLLAARARERAVKLPNEEALAHLEELMRENDKIPNRLNRVPASEAMRLLASHGWPCGRSKFDQLIREQYSRRWEA